MKMVIVVGARPNFMKVQPLFKRIREFNIKFGHSIQPIQTLLVHTGQHYDDNMSDVFFRDLGIRKPDINLNVGSGPHSTQTAQIMLGFERICTAERPDWVVVVGDVNSTMAATLVCAKIGVRVAHIEAGLRSFDRTMPEEINRLVTDALADLLMTPSEDANENLLREGVQKERIKFVGNIMIDSLIDNLPNARSSVILSRLRLFSGQFIYVTLHRPINVDHKNNLKNIVHSLDCISRLIPVVFSVHPRTRKNLEEFRISITNNKDLNLVAPLGYHESLCLTENARIVLTDSGGLQEEATYFRTPCLTLRPNTERPVTLTLGSNRLTNCENLLKDIEELLDGPDRIGQIPPLWDGETAKRTLLHIIEVS